MLIKERKKEREKVSCVRQSSMTTPKVHTKQCYPQYYSRMNNNLCLKSLPGLISLSGDKHRSDCYTTLYLTSLLQLVHLIVFPDQESQFF